MSGLNQAVFLNKLARGGGWDDRPQRRLGSDAPAAVLDALTGTHRHAEEEGLGIEDAEKRAAIGEDRIAMFRPFG
jgi:hypothetical protein